MTDIARSDHVFSEILGVASDVTVCVVADGIRSVVAGMAAPGVVSDVTVGVVTGAMEIFDSGTLAGVAVCGVLGILVHPHLSVS